MRVLLSTYGSGGYVEPMVGLAVRLRALGVEVRVCAPPDFAELLAGSIGRCQSIPRSCGRISTRPAPTVLFGRIVRGSKST